MHDHQLNYWISKHFQMGLVLVKGRTDFGNCNGFWFPITSTRISAAVVSLLTSSLLLMLWFWRRGVNLPSWSSHSRVWDNVNQSRRKKSEKYQQSLRKTNAITLLHNMLSTCSRCYQGCTILHVIAHWKEQNSVSKTTKIKKICGLKKEMNQEMNMTLQLYITMCWWSYGNRQGERFHYQIKKNPNHSSRFNRWVLKKFVGSNRLFNKSKREVVQRN